MKLTEAEMRMVFQIESTNQNAALNEIYMTWRYAPNPATKETAEGLLDKLRPLSDQECMKKPTYKGKELLPLSVIDAARDGDSQAVDQVLRYYEGYINKLCTRTLYDPDGQPHVRVDEYMKRRLEIKLIHSIVSMS